MFDKILKEIKEKGYQISDNYDNPFTLSKEVLESGNLNDKPET